MPAPLEIELFLIKNVSVVISDRYEKTNQIINSPSDQRKWGYASGESGGPPSLKSIEIQTPTPTPPTPFRSIEGPLSNSTNQRGQPTLRSKSRVDAMLERALTQPQQCSVDPLSNALNWGIPIWSTYELQAWLEKITVSLKDSYSSKQDICSRDKGLKVKHLKEPYIKFESYRRESRPVFVELKSWPTFNFDGDPGSCPFDIKGKEGEITTINKEIKENKEKYINPNISKGKDMTRRPRATATRARKTENTGYCGICRIDYRNLAKHLQSDQHLNFVQNEKNFLSLDNLIGTEASVEAFLKINRSKDVSKECDLFSNHSLDNGIFSSSNEKSEKKDKSNLNNFNLDEINMIECNGARRNLSLKLDSPHNLRTRIKHESGHSLRSKGRPWSEEDKQEKSFDKFTIKKRAKGTIWIEEEDSEEEKNIENEQCDSKSSFERLCESETKRGTNNSENSSENILINGDIFIAGKAKEASLNKITKNNALTESLLEANLKTKVNGYEKKEEKYKTTDVLPSGQNNDHKKGKLLETKTDSENVSIFNSGGNITPIDNENTNSLRSIISVNKEDRGKTKIARRGGRSYRGRHRLSVEERLIEDNRDYYKVEVLGNKLRSSTIPSNSVIVSPSKEQIDKSKKDDNTSNEKPVVVRFKRVRKSELSLLSDEAESFMFGDPRRDDESSENSDGEQSSILPKDTDSEQEETMNSFAITSSPSSNSLKKEVTEDERQELNLTHGRARKRRRTQTEALIMDNTDYYKFETPGSRLRYQAPLTGISDSVLGKEFVELANIGPEKVVEKTYPSKPSPEIEKMHFSFEAVPKSEPWYQTYQRQDEGAEFWHYFSESDSQKPFLLPYEIENFQESLQKVLQSGMHRKRGRSRGGHVNIGVRSPRKSPRCHASTLAIMSTIIKKREQQTSNLSTIEEEDKTKFFKETAKCEKKCSEKSDVDEDLKEIVRNLDEMLSSNDMQDLESFEADLLKNPDEAVLVPENLSRGAPANLLELLDNCHDNIQASGIDNSSCASSECGEQNLEFPLKRRKKRKNKTGWPGNKMRRKLQIKQFSEELRKELYCEKSMEDSVNVEKILSGEYSLTTKDNIPNILQNEEKNEKEFETGKENEQVNNDNKNNIDIKELEEVESKTVLKSVSSDEITSRRRPHDDSDKCSMEDERQLNSENRQCEAKGRLSSISEDSEASMFNNENLCEKDANSLITTDKSVSLKKLSQKRKRNNTISSNASHHMEMENRRQTTLDTPLKKEHNQAQTVDLSSKANKVRKKSKKHQTSDKSPTKLIYDNEECKKESLLTASVRKKLKRIKRDGSASSEIQHSEFDSVLSERVSPSFVASSDIDQRRSSIDFQPVVRVMKIEDQVDMDNSVLAVAVASNRRLRSSSSPRSNMQPPNKRFRHTSRKRQFSGQWIKHS